MLPLARCLSVGAGAIESLTFHALRRSATFVLLIDETGRVADCTVIETSGVASLDAQTCGAVKLQARFKPAIGLDGKPAKDGVVQRVSWILE